MDCAGLENVTVQPSGRIDWTGLHVWEELLLYCFRRIWWYGIPIYASSKDSWKLNLQQNSSPRRDGLGQMTLLTGNMVLQRIPRNWLHNDDAVRILPGIIWNQCHFYRKSNFNGLLRIFVFMKFPKTVSKQECCQNSPQGRDGRAQSDCENELKIKMTSFWTTT